MLEAPDLDAVGGCLPCVGTVLRAVMDDTHLRVFVRSDSGHPYDYLLGPNTVTACEELTKVIHHASLAELGAWMNKVVREGRQWISGRFLWDLTGSTQIIKHATFSVTDY